MKYIKLISVFCFAFFLCQDTFAQRKGKVEVIKDPQIDSLIAKRAELNKSANPGSAVSITGFRVQIFSGPDRTKAYAEQARFKTLYPAIKTYISYTQPNYKVRAGDFRGKPEAEKLMNELKKHYSNLFIFSDKINLK